MDDSARGRNKDLRGRGEKGEVTYFDFFELPSEKKKGGEKGGGKGWRCEANQRSEVVLVLLTVVNDKDKRGEKRKGGRGASTLPSSGVSNRKK